MAKIIVLKEEDTYVNVFLYKEKDCIVVEKKKNFLPPIVKKYSYFLIRYLILRMLK